MVINQDIMPEECVWAMVDNLPEYVRVIKVNINMTAIGIERSYFCDTTQGRMTISDNMVFKTKDELKNKIFG